MKPWFHSAERESSYTQGDHSPVTSGQSRTEYMGEL